MLGCHRRQEDDQRPRGSPQLHRRRQAGALQRGSELRRRGTISSVRRCSLGEVTEQEWTDDGFTSQEDLLAGLDKWYPGSLTLDSDVTVLRWHNVQGKVISDNQEPEAEVATQ